MTYAHLVVWMWMVALATTLVAFAYARRALARAEAAVAAVREAARSFDGLSAPAAELARATEVAVDQRVLVEDRVEVAPAG